LGRYPADTVSRPPDRHRDTVHVAACVFPYARFAANEAPFRSTRAGFIGDGVSPVTGGAGVKVRAFSVRVYGVGANKFAPTLDMKTL
jgi:hypothetical protein